LYAASEVSVQHFELENEVKILGTFRRRREVVLNIFYCGARAILGGYTVSLLSF
jgi:hypothetical protein